MNRIPPQNMGVNEPPFENGRPPRKSRRRRLLPWIILIIILLLISLWIWHRVSSSSTKHVAVKPLPVVVAPAHFADVPVYLDGLGSVTPTFSVTVRTQVNGQLLRVNFREGQMVKKGDLLAEIDPRPFLAQLMQFQGNLDRDQAQLANAKIDLKRYKRLYPAGAVSEQTYATQASLVNQLEGTVKSDQGQIAQTQVNLIYTRITSPIDGRVGLRLVDPGNFVQTTDTNGIVVVNMVHPITVVFTLPEDNIPQVMQQMRTGKTLITQAYDRTQNRLLSTGKLLTIDNQIDPTTGTVKLKAEFSNEDDSLFPDQFVNIKLLVDTLHYAVLVPTSAIQRGPNGTFVYVLNKNNTVSIKPVTTGITYGFETVITSGISPQQSVVVEGADKLTDGAAVSITPLRANPPKNNNGVSTTNTSLLILPAPSRYEVKQRGSKT